jgi:predicted membrane protein
MLLAKKMGIFFLHIHFIPVIFILLGVYSGIKHRFHNLGSWALITLGLFLMIPKFWVLGVLSTHLVAPLILILIGLFLLVKSYRFKNNPYWTNTNQQSNPVSDDSFLINANFGEQQKIVTSKKFEGGTMDINFSNVTINLMDADFDQTTTININATCSEVRILLPDSWNVTVQAENYFSTVNDRRWQVVNGDTPTKNIIITGKLNFSEIKLKSR